MPFSGFKRSTVGRPFGPLIIASTSRITALAEVGMPSVAALYVDQPIVVVRSVKVRATTGVINIGPEEVVIDCQVALPLASDVKTFPIAGVPPVTFNCVVEETPFTYFDNLSNEDIIDVFTGKVEGSLPKTIFIRNKGFTQPRSLDPNATQESMGSSTTT